MNHFGDFSDRLVLDAEASNQCFECAAIAMMGELYVHHVERKDLAIRRNYRGENKLSSRIDESADQPCSSDTVDFGTRSCQPGFAAVIFRVEARQRFLPCAFSASQQHLHVLSSRALKKIDITDCSELTRETFKFCRLCLGIGFSAACQKAMQRLFDHAVFFVTGAVKKRNQFLIR